MRKSPYNAMYPSQDYIGAAMMQNGQPVAYESRALTLVESRYAQIEKELLAVVFTCDHFDAYTYMGTTEYKLKQITSH